jgi:hypothetical protein
MKDARRRKPVIDQLRHAFPCESISLAAPPKRSSPEIGHVMSECRERPAIGWDRIVGEVASHYLAQPLSLFGYRLVHSTLQLYLDVLQLTPHAVASGLSLKHESAAARSSTDESEAQEGERFWLSKPTLLIPLEIAHDSEMKSPTIPI